MCSRVVHVVSVPGIDDTSLILFRVSFFNQFVSADAILCVGILFHVFELIMGLPNIGNELYLVLQSLPPPSSPSYSLVKMQS